MYSAKKGFSFDGKKVSAQTVIHSVKVIEFRFRSSGVAYLSFFLPDGIRRDYPSTYRNCMLVQRLKGPVIERRD